RPGPRGCAPWASSRSCGGAPPRSAWCADMRAMLRGFAVAAATVLVAAATAVLPTAPAHAALCGGSGVNVIASFGALGGGTQTGCAASGGGSSAWQISVAAGFPLEQ